MSDGNSHRPTDADQIERRPLLKGLAAAGGAGLFGAGGAGTAAADQLNDDGRFNTFQQLQNHLEHRGLLDDLNQRDLVDNPGSEAPPGSRNDDEDYEAMLYRGGHGSTSEFRPWVFSKGLTEDNPYGQRMFVLTKDHQQLDEVLSALNEGKPLTGDGTPDVPKSSGRPFVAMPSASSYTSDGTSGMLPVIPSPPAFDDGRTYLEMIEAYAMALLRRVPFADLSGDWTRIRDGSSTYVFQVMNALENDVQQIRNACDCDDDWFHGVDSSGNVVPDELFRDPIYGCHRGPVGSQVWYHDVPIGGISCTPTVEPITGVDGPKDDYDLYHLNVDGPPFCTTVDQLEENYVKRGGAEPGHDDDVQVDLTRGSSRYVHNGLDLASQVRDDPAYQPYLLAALQISNKWGVPVNTDLPYVDDVPEVHPYIDFGAVGLLDLIARVCRNALISAWHQKWFVHRRPRPEAYAHRINHSEDFGLDDLVIPNQWSGGSSEIASLVEDEFGSALLPQVYPEGGPAHPAYPSGHSVIAGACATVLRSFFQNLSLSDLEGFQPRQPTADGSDTEDYNGGDLTVHGEINKFASNIGLARIWAGVHYRSDHLYGMLLGEQVAVATMYDHFTRNDELSEDYRSEPLPNSPATIGIGHNRLGYSQQNSDGVYQRYGETVVTGGYFDQLRDYAMTKPF